MDRTERYNSPLQNLRTLIQSELLFTWVALPGVVQSFNAADLTATVQPAIQMQMRDQSGVWQPVNIPPIPKAVVQFFGNKQFICTIPLQPGDEGLLVFCDRCIDGWWQNGAAGGPVPQAEFRQHDLTDAIFIPGIRSVGNVPANINGTSAEFRTFSGNTKITFDDTNGIVLTSAVGIKLAGNVTVTEELTIDQGLVVDGALQVDGLATLEGGAAITGNLPITGNITATGDITAGQGTGDSVTLQNHIHIVPNALTGAVNSDPPTAGT